MKKLALAGIIGLCLAMIFFCSSPTFAADKVKFYVEGEVGSSFANLDSGGNNLLDGGFPNTGDDWDVTVVPGVHVGAELFRFVRADLSYNYRGILNFTTNSFQPPTPTFFYDTDFRAHTLMFSLYLEPLHYKNWTPYIGAGVGNTWMQISTDDTVVEGSGNKTSFSWQAEAGIEYALSKHFALRLGYRYIDMGSFKISLEHGMAGNFKGDVTAHEVLFGVRYTF